MQALLEFFGMSSELRRKILKRGPQSENQRWSRALHTRVTCKRSQTKPRNETAFCPTLGPNQSEREKRTDIHKDMLYLTSIRVRNMQTPSFFWRVPSGVLYIRFTRFTENTCAQRRNCILKNSKHMIFRQCARPVQATQRWFLWLRLQFSPAARQFNNRLASTVKLPAAC